MYKNVHKIILFTGSKKYAGNSWMGWEKLPNRDVILAKSPSVSNHLHRVKGENRGGQNAARGPFTAHQLRLVHSATQTIDADRDFIL